MFCIQLLIQDPQANTLALFLPTILKSIILFGNLLKKDFLPQPLVIRLKPQYNSEVDLLIIEA